jgi:hypothetical protein
LPESPSKRPFSSRRRSPDRCATGAAPGFLAEAQAPRGRGGAQRRKCAPNSASSATLREISCPAHRWRERGATSGPNVLLILIVLAAAGYGGYYLLTSGPGEIEVATPGVAIELRSGDKTITVTSKEKVTADAGTYKTKTISFTTYEPDGYGGTIAWRISSGGPFGDLKTVKVRKGRTTVIEAGPPFVAKPKVKDDASGSDRTLHIGLEIIGKCGECYNEGIHRGQLRVSSFRCRVIHESGQVLTLGLVEYG